MGQVVTVEKRGNLLYFPKHPTAAQVDKGRKPVYLVKQPFSAHSSGGWMEQQDDVIPNALRRDAERLEAELSRVDDELSRVRRALAGVDGVASLPSTNRSARPAHVFPHEYEHLTVTDAVVNYLNRKRGSRTDFEEVEKALAAGGRPTPKQGIMRGMKKALTQSKLLVNDDKQVWLADDKVACSPPVVQKQRGKKEKSAS